MIGYMSRHETVIFRVVSSACVTTLGCKDTQVHGTQVLGHVHLNRQSSPVLHAHDDTLWNAQTLYRQMTNHRTHSSQRHDVWLKTQRTTQPLTVITTWQRSRWLRPAKRRRIVLDSCRRIKRVVCGKLARTLYFVLTFVACVLQAVRSSRTEQTVQDQCSASRR